jgi:hypothetical protein
MKLTKTRIVLIIEAIGAVVFLAGIFGDGNVSEGDLRAVGVGIIICTLTWRFTTSARPTEQAIYEAGRAYGHSQGYDTGYADGRSVARPVVVGSKAWLASCRPASGPAQQLGEQVNIARGPEIVLGNGGPQ